MCSLAGDVMLEETLSNKQKFDVCKKCFTETPSIILRKTDAYCKSCFLLATVHKFRATLGKYRIIRPNERVLILYETGHPSTALLHFIRSGLDIATHKKLRFEPIILYIDEHKGISTEKRYENYKNVAAEINSYNFTGYITSLHNFINNMNESLKLIETKNDIIIDLVQSLDANLTKTFANRTLYDDTTNLCRRQLLWKVAKQLNCSIVLTPDISADIAIHMLSNLSLGRGSHLSLDTGILDDRDPEIKILQPLRYFDMKELAFYNIFNNINPISTKQLTKESATTSVNNLITKFVYDLQENYPSTIKTVVRTGDKLTCSKTGQICDLCKARVDVQTDLCSSEARDFSHWVSTHANDSNLNDINYNNDEHINDRLCYGCRNISNALKI